MGVARKDDAVPSSSSASSKRITVQGFAPSMVGGGDSCGKGAGTGPGPCCPDFSNNNNPAVFIASSPSPASVPVDGPPVAESAIAASHNDTKNMAEQLAEGELVLISGQKRELSPLSLEQVRECDYIPQSMQMDLADDFVWHHVKSRAQEKREARERRRKIKEEADRLAAEAEAEAERLAALAEAEALAEAKRVCAAELQEKLDAQNALWEPFYDHQYRIGDKFDLWDPQYSKFYEAHVLDAAIDPGDKRGVLTLVTSKSNKAASGKKKKKGGKKRKRLGRDPRFKEEANAMLEKMCASETVRVCRVFIKFKGFKNPKWNRWVQLPDPDTLREQVNNLAERRLAALEEGFKDAEIAPIAEDYEDAPGPSIAPQGMFSGKETATKPKKEEDGEKNMEDDEGVGHGQNDAQSEAIESHVAPTLPEVSDDATQLPLAESPPRASGRPSRRAAAAAKANLVAAATKTVQKTDFNDFHCSHCFQFATDGAPIICCDGPCLRSFHLKCLKMTTAPEGAWLCPGCTKKQYECASCGKTGYVATAESANGRPAKRRRKQVRKDGLKEVIKCKIRSCGKFYHAECAEKNLRTSQKKYEPISGRLISFKCPVHKCVTCSEDTDDTLVIKEKVRRCMKCLAAYHGYSCMPESAEVLREGMLCGQCADGSLIAFADERHKAALEVAKARKAALDMAKAKQQPAVDGESTNSDTMAMDEEKPEEKMEEEENDEEPHGPVSFPQFEAVENELEEREATLRKRNDVNHFRLPVSIILAVHHSPPEFEKIRRNIYVDCKPILDKQHLENGQCGCKGKCDDRCQNRMLYVECVESKNNKNRQNCSVGTTCGNRCIGSRKFKKVKPFVTPGKGWGLKTLEDIKSGEFVIEYVGEVITAEASEQRLLEQFKANDRHLFHMELHNDRIIDARWKGNVSRFVNHCCEPNMKIQIWNVNGQTRVGMFAIKDIAKETELSYDYQMMGSKKTELKCLCGTPSCRGTLKSLSQKEKDEIELQAQVKEQEKKISRNKGIIPYALLREMAKKKEKETARIASAEENRLRKLNLTGRLLPGSTTESAAHGPSDHEKELVTSRSIFLWRNAQLGKDLLARSTKARGFVL